MMLVDLVRSQEEVVDARPEPNVTGVLVVR